MSTVSSPIGDNLARVRKARGLTQEELAAASGVSVDVIARLEQGRKKGARWTTLIKLANALGVQLAVLVTPPALLGGGGDPQAGEDLTALRRALTSNTDILGTADLAEDADLVPLDALSRTVGRAWNAYQRGEFTAVARALPTLIGDARRIVHDSDSDGDRLAAAHTALSTCYSMAAGITVMRGHQDLALTAVERAFSSARRANGPLPAAAAAVFLSWILLKQGRYGEAEQAAVVAAGRIEPSFTRATRTQLATFGNLMINASCAAVRAGAAARADDLLAVARAAATRHGTDGVDQWSVFGPRVVAMYAACNAAERHDIDAALRHAAIVPPPTGGTLPPTWEARYLLTMAFAHSEAGEDATAVRLLSQARDTAPEWITYHPLAATVVLEQLERPRKPSDELAALATHLRVL
jgi:transcriptional regulator with XRE-family HTH domain